MIWILLVFSSTFLGYQLIPLFRITNLTILPRFFSGWLLGSIGTGIVFYITSYIIPISFLHSFLIIIAQISGSYFLMKSKRTYKSNLLIDPNPWFFFLIIFTAGISLSYLAKIYRKMPNNIPNIMVPFYDDEMSFITSVLYGCNRRRSNPFFFKNPRISNFIYYGYPVPLLYTAGLMSLGASYSDASIIICFMNIMVTTFTFYYISKKYIHWPVMATIIFLFSGSWASYIYLRYTNRSNLNNDLVHRFTPTHSCNWYQPFACLLSMSKSASYAIAMAQCAINWTPTIMSPILAMLIPSTLTSFATFGVLCGLPNMLPKIIPFALTLLLRLHPFVYRFLPIYREAEMRGTFFAPIMIWFIALGPMFLVLFFFGWKGIEGKNKRTRDSSDRGVEYTNASRERFQIHLFASIGPFLLLHFFREGTSSFENILAITATVFPVAVILFTDLMRRYSRWPTDEEYRGCAIFIMTATFAFLLYGGYLCMSRIVKSVDINILFTKNALEIAKFINEKVSPGAVIFIYPKKLNPIILTGRQAYIGDKQLLWESGVQFQSKLDDYDNLVSEQDNVDLFKKLGIHYVIQESDKLSIKNRLLKTQTQNREFRLCII